MRDVRIESERLVIRELRDDDWRTLHAVESLPEINRYQAYDAHTEQASRDLIARAQREAACEPRHCTSSRSHAAATIACSAAAGSGAAGTSCAPASCGACSRRPSTAAAS
jgi:hypothetical protein